MCQLVPIVYREKNGREVTRYSVYPCKETIDQEWEEAKAFLRRNDPNGKLPWEYPDDFR